MQSRRNLMSNADENMARQSLEEIKGSRRHMAVASARDDYSEASPLQVVVDTQQGTPYVTRGTKPVTVMHASSERQDLNQHAHTCNCAWDCA